MRALYAFAGKQMKRGESSKKVVAIQTEEVRAITALVVDDDPQVRGVHVMLLATHGLQIQTAANGKEAVDLFLSGNNFDLVLMDKVMPVMDGPQATRMLRGMGVDSMIVGVSAESSEAEQAAFMEAGLDYFWEKPLNPRDIISILNELAKKVL